MMVEVNQQLVTESFTSSNIVNDIELHEHGCVPSRAHHIYVQEPHDVQGWAGVLFDAAPHLQFCVVGTAQTCLVCACFG